MDFVNGDGAAEFLALAARFFIHCVVAPGIVEIPDERRGFGRGFVAEAIGIGLVHAITVVPGDHVILVGRAPAQFRDKPGPDAGAADGLQRMCRLAPAVEVAR